jgi:hypothetical protein
MKTLDLEETYRRLRDEWFEATQRVSRIAVDRRLSRKDVGAARQRAADLNDLVNRARTNLARALSADGMPVMQIASRLGTTLVSAIGLLSTEGDSNIEN